MTAWQLSGACRDHDPEWWFADDEPTLTVAKAICAGCPVRHECAAAGADEPDGVWGGLDAADRLGLMLLATPEPPPHVPSRGCYVAGCKTPECREENRRYIAEVRRRVGAPVTESATVVVTEQLEIGALA